MDYRVAQEDLMETLALWDELMTDRGPIHLIACGGTALTLLGYKESTKDVDFLVPVEKEYQRLIRFLRQAGYQKVTGDGWKRPNENAIYDLYCGKRIYVTELLTSPLSKGGHRKIRQWKRICLGVLNPADLVISKLFRGTQVDFQDCTTLVQREKMDFNRLEKRYRETAKYDVSEDRLLKNWNIWSQRVRKQ